MKIQNRAFFLLYIKKLLTMKGPYIALFVALTGVGKTHLALDLLKLEYLNHFNFIIILCPTLQYNKTYQQLKWFRTDSYVIPVEPGNRLYDWIEKLGNLLAGFETLFLIDNIIANETLDKRR